MAFFAVSYTYTSDTERLDAIRPEHRAYLRAQEELVAAGPLVGTDPGRAFLIFDAADEERLRDVLDGDPFQEAGLIARREVHPWTPAVGIFADRL